MACAQDFTPNERGSALLEAAPREARDPAALVTEVWVEWPGASAHRPAGWEAVPGPVPGCLWRKAALLVSVVMACKRPPGLRAPAWRGWGLVAERDEGGSSASPPPGPRRASDWQQELTV